jgi:hypothetical protein
MKKLALGILVLALASPLAAATWEGVSLMDAGCASKEEMVAHPDDHTTSCAKMCSKAGYGAIVDGKFVKFDDKGNELAAAALKATDKKDHLRANITGEMQDDVLHVTALTLQ